MSNALFTTVPVPKFPRSTFNLSRPVLFTPRMHKEYPTEILEVIPGDGFKVWSEAYAKSQPMVAPTFAKMDTAQESFFVPAWQLSERFDDFITGGERGMNTDKMPYVTVGVIYNILYHYLEIYCGLAGGGLNINWSLYNERLTKVQDIIESFDVMRSIPFVVPDFVLLTSGMSETDAENIGDSNVAAFEDLNNQCESSPLRINLLPFAAVLKIWCEFYRDENLCEDLYSMYWKAEGDPQEGFNGFEFHKATGNVDAYIEPVAPVQAGDYVDALHALFGLKSRAWKKDYFTSALPFVQKGPDVVLPMEAEVSFYGGVGSPSAVPVKWSRVAASETGILTAAPEGVTPQPILGKVNQASIGTSIQDVRTAFKLEELYEADGRFGNRYPENTLGQFGVHTPDSRLPRCQYLGGSKQPIQIQQVIQNSSTDSESPQGNLAGLSSTYGSNKLFKTYQSQHGFVVCLTCIRVHSLYQQGIHPMFSRYDRTEYAWPRFANLGEQAIYTKQLDVRAAEDEVFGYTPRYADYKSDTGSIHGKLKGSLNYWTMARRFANKPVLNENFIYSRPRQDAFVVNNWLEPCFIMEIDYHVRANRVLPFYGSPHI